MCQNKSNEMDIFRIQLTMVFVTERASAKACTCFSWVIIIIINPRRACAARVTVQCSWFPCMYVCVYVCMCVCVFALICRLTHWNHKRGIPMASSQYGNYFLF